MTEQKNRTNVSSTGLAARISRIRRTPYGSLAIVASLLLGIIILSAIAADLVAPYDPRSQELSRRLAPPMTPGVEGEPPHVLGTDALGRDVLSRVIYGARVSLLVAGSAALISGLIGITLGVLAGYYGGRWATVIMRVVDAALGFPSLMLALFVLFVIGPSLGSVVLVLALTRWMVYARVARGLTLGVRDQPYVLAARTIGVGNIKVILTHVLPNILPPLLVLAAVEMAYLILAEAALSFLGLGIQPPDSSWGLMIADGRVYMTTAWWLIIFPGIAILITTLSFNWLSLAMRSLSRTTR